MYESILKVATGNPNLNFSVISVPFPQNDRQRSEEEEVNGVFVTFVIGIAFSLIPASIVSRIVNEKERGLNHMQIVSGVDKLAYYGSFYL